MTFTIRPNRANMQWIRKHIKKSALKVERAALDQWTTEGGSSANQTTAKRKHIVVVAGKSA